ncbi:MAG: site-2 protease family protein [Candidatus Micrarchaeales archaeon]|nr:site-2 protease family protein [Candidatus Micrarchaeales archaeon]
MANPSGMSLGRISGIEIEMHWTFLFLVMISLLYSIFFGLFLFIFIVLLFAMVVLHELMHSITALRNGIKVKKIILLPLGGASIIDLDEVKPEVSLRIALAGPLASILLGLFFGLLAVIAPPISLQPFIPLMLNQLMQLLFLLNMLLGVFNLVPAFPLDGGRMLKSFLAERMDDLRATKMAVNVSKGILAVIIIGSLAYAAYYPGQDSSNWILIVLWNFIIVLFIYSAAQAELENAYIMKYTSTLKVRDAVTKNFITINPTTPMRELYKSILKSGTHIAVFRDAGAFRAVTRLSVNPFNQESQEILSKTAREYSVEIPSVDYNAPLPKAIKKMRYEEAPLVAVTRAGKLVGVLQSQHVESIIALHLPHEMGDAAESRN